MKRNAAERVSCVSASRTQLSSAQRKRPLWRTTRPEKGNNEMQCIHRTKKQPTSCAERSCPSVLTTRSPDIHIYPRRRR